jgi:hypothetical protein
MNNIHRQAIPFLLGLVAILLFCLPYFVLGSSAYITINDYLDLTIGHIKSIISNNLFFSMGEGTLPLMDGINRDSLPFTGPWEIKNIFFLLFPSYWGVVGNMLIVKFCAFIGMFVLLDRYIIKNNRILILIISLLFACIPFYIDYGFSSAGIPLVVYALLNLYNRKSVFWNYIIVALYALNSSLALSGFFVCFFLFFACVVISIKKHQIKVHLLSALLLLIVIYLLSNWSLISGYFFPSDFVSNRMEMVRNNSLGVLFMNFLSIIHKGHYHSGNFDAIPIILSSFIVYVLYGKKNKMLTACFFSLLAIIFSIGIGLLLRLIPLQIFASFQFDRFYFLYASFCFILLCKVCDVLIKHNKLWISVVVILSVAFGILRFNQEYLINVKQLIGQKSESPSYAQFYDTQLFQLLSKDLDISQDYSVKVISLGLYPSIAEYNGFYCLDGYATSYSLSYKHKFREIIADELKKNQAIQTYFDNWGNRCYLFCSELDLKGNRYLCSKVDNMSVDNLNIHTEILKELGCEYIISAVDINNFNELNLEYINSYTTDSSFWRIRVYKVL